MLHFDHFGSPLRQRHLRRLKVDVVGGMTNTALLDGDLIARQRRGREGGCFRRQSDAVRCLAGAANRRGAGEQKCGGRMRHPMGRVFVERVFVEFTYATTTLSDSITLRA
jgi:hypothetical protein